ncbi:MAG: aminotransferase class I/II-fold pyridoxal phosphate-dependent enzyme [Candidatus Spechtbacteria bacterium]|nr:aminotransferase class I/II-fold pyridoxal phosphate-dependent enzyme [Candidatus Spechtbacteria bacterium]
MKIEPSKRLNSIPSYALAVISDKVAALRNDGIKIIDFGVGDPSEPTPDFVIEKLTEFGRKHATTGYPSYIGSKDFRGTAAAYMQKRFGVELDPEREISSNLGSKEAIFNFPEGFINPGDIVICPSPGYPPMKTGTIFAEGVPYYVPLLQEYGFLIDYDSIPQDIAVKAKIIWINYPNSPTGAVASRDYYEGLINWAHKNDIIIAADEGCYIDIYFDEKPASILEVSREGIVAFYSLSKRNNMTGYRVGFVCGDEKIIKIFKDLKTNIDSGTPSIVQEAGILALADEEHAEHMRHIYRQKRDLLLPALKDIGLEVRESPATFYIWQKVNGSDIEFAQYLLEPDIGIVVTPGSSLSDECEGGINPGYGYVRIALIPTMEEIEEAVVKLKKLKL